MIKIFSQLKDTFTDLNNRWGALGSLIIMTLAIASVVANLLQIWSYFPESQTITVPIAPVVTVGLVIVSALASLAFQISRSDVVTKRKGITQLTDIFVIRPKGELYFGDIRNILVRLGTIQQILIGISDGREVEDSGRKALQKVGKKIGLMFGDQFIDQHGVKEKTLHDMIDAWCEYDVDAGWGRFVFLPGSSEFVGSIQVRSNFLTSSLGALNLNQSLCGFLEGYISGILEVFTTFQYPLKRLNVEVTERICGIHDGGHSPCGFDFIIREIIDP